MTNVKPHERPILMSKYELINEFNTVFQFLFKYKRVFEKLFDFVTLQFSLQINIHRQRTL